MKPTINLKTQSTLNQPPISIKKRPPFSRLSSQKDWPTSKQKILSRQDNVSKVHTFHREITNKISNRKRFRRRDRASQAIL
jgi:hypothetical protein